MQTAVVDYSALDKRIESLTRDLQPHFETSLKKMNKAQADTIVRYVATMMREFNPRKATRRNLFTVLINLDRFVGRKAFSEITKQDIELWLDSVRRPDEDDPTHKWIGTYNQRIANGKKFFRWLNWPDVESYERAKMMPPQFKGIRRLKRKEESGYKPSDMWTAEDDQLFLKYCPSSRIKCYHSMSRDTSARPAELLKLKIKEVVFKLGPGGQQYAEIVVSGKTKQRPLPLINSISYVKKWLNEHPMKNNPEAPLFPNALGKNRGKAMDSNALWILYVMHYQKGIHNKKKDLPGYFQRLLQDPEVPREDKEKLEVLLQKRWNPYVRRHTGLTEKRPLLPATTFNLYSGHSPNSKQPNIYTHFFGSEASEKILELAGIIKPDHKKSVQEMLKPKSCPNCGEPNTLDAKFCENEKCKMVLSIQAYADQKSDMENMVRKMIEEQMSKKHGKALARPFD